MRLVYLAGSIKGLSYTEAVAWREYVASEFPNWIKTISPMRGKKYLEKENKIADSYGSHLLSTSKGILVRDHNDVCRCDALLVNFLGAKSVSIGTVSEISWAYLLKKPVIVVMEDGNVHNHAFVREQASLISSDLDEGIDLVVKLLAIDEDL